MASVSLAWGDAGIDIHVLKGETSPSLLDLLFIQEDTTPPKFSAASSPPADVDKASVKFTPNFLSLKTPPFNSGITVNTGTGEVKVDSPRPAPPRLQSFVLEATVTTKPPAAKTLGPIPIRVCVHDSIRDFWLTPNPLTIRKNADGQQFSVLAEFDDGTIGDITRRPGFAWATVKAADSGKVVIDPASGAMKVTVPAGTFDVKATHAGLTRTAKVKAEKPWSTPTAVTLVPGSGGVKKAAKVPNILFLPDGFTAAEKTKFEAFVKQIVTKLQSTPTLRPFDLVKGAVNYFMAFVPSRERGCSALYDMTLVGRKPLFGKEIDDPVKGAAGAPFTLANLIYEVGLPTPADATVTVDSARGRWALQYGPHVSLAFSDAVYLDWQTLHDHRLANERDTAFGFRSGERPTMDTAQGRVPRSAGFNPRRTRPEHLVDLLRNLKLKKVTGPMIGTIWAKQTGAVPDPSDPALPAGLKVGQDRGRIFILLGGTRFGGAGPSDEVDEFVVSIRDDGEIGLELTAGSKQVSLVPFALPSTPSIETLARIAHETCHAFGLGDEYGEFESPLRIPTSKEGELTAFGNVQPASVLAKSAADPSLDPAKLDKIKWLWPRVDAAGVLAAKPDPLPVPPPVPPLINIKLQPGHAAASNKTKPFAPDDVVELRRRPLIDHPTPSGRLTVVAVSGDIVTVTPPPFSTTITPDDWPVGSVLIRPVRKTPLDPFSRDLPLIAPTILTHLGTRKVPLNLPPPAAGKPITACVKNDDPRQDPVDLPKGLPARRPTFKSQIVGLYDGGHRFFCGVYHPSGVCLMRRLTVPDPKKVPKLKFPAYLLCPVCRYVIVDRIDPTKHAVIDKDLEKRYPEP